MSKYRRHHIEKLENKRLLAVDWINQGQIGNDADNFQGQYGVDNAIIARQIVNRSISDWNRVITDQNFDNDNDPNTTPNLALTISAADIGAGGLTNITQVTTGGAGQAGWTAGVPTAATIQLDNDNGTIGWFFDSTPNDDIEFTAIGTPFESSFVNANNGGTNNWIDFYLVVTHEIGHSLGIALGAVPGGTLRIFSGGNLFTADWDGNDENETDTAAIGGGGDLNFFQHPNGTFTTLTPNGGGHIYEGGLADHLNTPVFPNELMNPGRTLPSAPVPPVETRRQFISDVATQLLADAYGYTVALPSTLDSAHVMLDSITGTLLVQGSARDNTTGVGLNDTFNIQRVTDAQGDDIQVTVTTPGGTFTERVPYANVTEILIHDNGHVGGGNDPVTVNANVDQPWQRIDYVVSSNEDALEAVGQSTTDGIVDLSNIVPGNQTTLRAAIVEANARTGAQSIYVGRGIYDLTLSGTDNAAAVGDLDITSDVTIIGAGAGATVIDAGGVGGLGDRIFELRSVGDLDISRLTLTGGNTTASGGAIYARAGTTLHIDQVALVDNLAGNMGGGLFNEGVAMITQSVVTSDTAGGAGLGGGGIFSSSISTFTMGSTIVVGNTATTGPRDDLEVNPNATTYSLGNNIIGATNYRWAAFDPGANDLVATADYVVTSLVDRTDNTNNDYALSIREAILQANGDTLATILLPAWNHRLAIEGNDSTSAQGDLDIAIAANITLVGAGAGLSVIDASAINDRVIDVIGNGSGGGTLDVSRLTLTGGVVTASGAGIYVRQNATATLDQVALVDNFAGGMGGSIFNEGTTTIVNSAVTTSTAGATNAGGGGIFSSSTSTFSMGSTVVINNTAFPRADLEVNPLATTTSLGNNIIGNTTIRWSAFNQTGTDIQTTADFVVTSVADTFSHANDVHSLSLREAIDLANDSAGSTVLLPAWTFVLTRDRATYGMGSMTDMEVGFGDLDISESLTIRRAGAPLAAGVHAVKWRAGLATNDRVFELLGDFDNDGFAGGQSASGSDFMVWQQQNGDGSVDPSEWEKHSADANDDGLVNQVDKNIWSENYGNTLTLHNLIGV